MRCNVELFAKSWQRIALKIAVFLHKKINNVKQQESIGLKMYKIYQRPLCET